MCGTFAPNRRSTGRQATDWLVRIRSHIHKHGPCCGRARTIRIAIRMDHTIESQRTAARLHGRWLFSYFSGPSHRWNDVRTCSINYINIIFSFGYVLFVWETLSNGMDMCVYVSCRRRRDWPSECVRLWNIRPVRRHRLRVKRNCLLFVNPTPVVFIACAWCGWELSIERITLTQGIILTNL